MKTITPEEMTIKSIRKAMRSLKKEDENELVRLLIPGWGQIEYCYGGSGCYAVGPLPENDDTDLQQDYDAWAYGCKESWILEWIEKKLDVQ